MQFGEYRRLLREAGPPEPGWYERASEAVRRLEGLAVSREGLDELADEAFGTGPRSFTFRLPVSQSAAEAVARHAAGEPGLRFPPPAPPLAG